MSRVGSERRVWCCPVCYEPRSTVLSSAPLCTGYGTHERCAMEPFVPATRPRLEGDPVEFPVRTDPVPDHGET